MPLWLLIYEKILSVPIHETAVRNSNTIGSGGLYAFSSALAGAVGAPLLIGVIIQKCLSGKPRALLVRLDRAIPPTCALFILVVFTVAAVNFGESFNFLDWQSIVACVLFSGGALLVGGVTAAVFRLKLPEVKAVALVACARNTLLVKLVIHASYSPADNSLMNAILQSLDLFTIAVMFVMYVVHVVLWCIEPTTSGSSYKSAHDHEGLGGLRYSIGEKIVRSMIQAGEIRFGRRLSPTTNSCHPNKISTIMKEENYSSAESLTRSQLISTMTDSTDTKLSSNCSEQDQPVSYEDFRSEAAGDKSFSDVNVSQSVSSLSHMGSSATTIVCS